MQAGTGRATSLWLRTFGLVALDRAQRRWALISEVGSSFPIFPGIYTGSAIDNLTAIGGSGTPQHQFVRVTAGVTYQIQVVGYGAAGH